MGFTENLFIVGLVVTAIFGGVLIVHGIGLAILWIEKWFR